MRLHESMIIQQSHHILDGLGPEAIGFMLAIEAKLSTINDPEIKWRSETLEPGFFRALLGKRRDVLVLQHGRLREHRVLIACRAHGAVLHVAWLAIAAPRLLNDVRRAVALDVEAGARFEVAAELDVVDLFDLRAFIGTTQLAVNDAIRRLAAGREETGAILAPDSN